MEGLQGPVAFLADIHGNLPALDAVLSALGASRAAAVFVAGDLVFPGEHPLEVWMRLQEVGARCVKGTSDRALATLDPTRLRPRDDTERARAERFAKTRTALGDVIVARLGKLPEALRLTVADASEWLVVYGSPMDPDTVITHDMDDDEVNALVGDDPADVVLCGGSHVSFVRKLTDVTVVGLGSVGEAPEGRTAHFTLVTPTDLGPKIDPRWVTY